MKTWIPVLVLAVSMAVTAAAGDNSEGEAALGLIPSPPQPSSAHRRQKASAAAAEADSDTSVVIRTYGQEYHCREVVVVDDFEGSEVVNNLGGKANIYVQNPSRIMVSRDTAAQGRASSIVLMLTYEKKKEGGPFNEGGWCGYYTLLKKLQHGREDIYFDAAPFKILSFKVRGRVGGENFMVGAADRHWDKVGDCVKSQEIGKYLPNGRITTEWQEANIPIDAFYLDRGKLSSFSFGFETACFPDGSGSGTVYIDDVALEK